jgi:DNA mismatch repair protein MSH2
MKTTPLEATDNGTIVGVWMGAVSAPASHTAPLLVWTLQPDLVQPVLTYYHFWDDTRSWDHLHALLETLHPIAVTHVYCDTKPKKLTHTAAAPPSPLATRLYQALVAHQPTPQPHPQNTSPTQPHTSPANTQAAALQFLQIHDTTPVLARDRVQAQLQQLVADGPWRVAGDATLVTHDNLLKSAAFFLHVTGIHGESPSTLRYRLDTGVLPGVLALDRTAADALHLWPPSHHDLQTNHNNSNHHNSNHHTTKASDSLWGVLSAHVVTPMGHARLRTWLRQPSTDRVRLQRRQDAVDILVRDGLGRDALHGVALRGLQHIDLWKLATQLDAFADDHHDTDPTTQNDDARTTAHWPVGTSPSQALSYLYQLYLVASQTLPCVVEHLEQLSSSVPQNSLLADLTTALHDVATDWQPSIALAEAVLDLDAAPREFLVQAAYREELGTLQRELQDVRDQVRDCHAHMNDLWASTTGNAQATVKLETADDGFLFRLTNTNDTKLLQNQLGNVVQIHKLLKNGVSFSTKELRQLATAQQDLMAEYDRQQKVVVQDALKVAATYSVVLQRAFDAVATLDVLVGLAHQAAYSPHGYCRPTLIDGDDCAGHGIQLQGARHPCVEVQESVSDYIPNDVDLTHDRSNVLLVTGPNMGGKSTYIRAVGAIVLLAQIGAFVPCQSATIHIRHHILARVGAGDWQDQGISTFLAEMLESAAILRTATARSLIIVDELGRGTSTFDGYGLARAIAEYMVRNVGNLCVFATHFHELTSLADVFTNVRNCHVTAQRDVQGLTFLYQIQPGPCLESFGIQVAELAGVPAVVVQDAQRKARELERFEYRGQESAAESDADWVARFRDIPHLSDMLGRTDLSDADKRAALAQALQV